MAVYEREYRGAPIGKGRSYVTWKNVPVGSAGGTAAALNVEANNVRLPAFFTVSMCVTKVSGSGDLTDLSVRTLHDFRNENTDTVVLQGDPNTIQVRTAFNFVNGDVGLTSSKMELFSYGNIRPHISVVESADPFIVDIHMILSPGLVKVLPRMKRLRQ